MSTAGAIRTEELMTLDEYLAFEEKSAVRHEYHAGHIYAMAGASVAHEYLQHNVNGSFYVRLREKPGKPCRGAGSNQRIRIEASDRSLYPDFTVLCRPERPSERDPSAIVNPSLIVEILSPSTENYDRGEKSRLYAEIPELRDYILIAQDMILVEHYRRGDSGEWILNRYNNRNDVIPLANLQIELPLDEVYEGIDVPSGLIVLPQVTE